MDQIIKSFFFGEDKLTTERKAKRATRAVKVANMMTKEMETDKWKIESQGKQIELIFRERSSFTLNE